MHKSEIQRFRRRWRIYALVCIVVAMVVGAIAIALTDELLFVAAIYVLAGVAIFIPVLREYLRLRRDHST